MPLINNGDEDEWPSGNSLTVNGHSIHGSMLRTLTLVAEDPVEMGGPFV